MGVYHKYRKLSKKEKQNLEKQLKKLGFFIIITFSICFTVNADMPVIDEVTNENPIVLPVDSMTQASELINSLIGGEISSSSEYLDEDIWRQNIALFLSDDYPYIINNYNNSSILNNSAF
jgi:hypothetical protein